MSSSQPIVFTLSSHPLLAPLCDKLPAQQGELERRDFPDGESYLRVCTDVANRDCIVLVDLAWPNPHYLPLIFLLETLKEFGANSVGVMAPYLSYMRQDKRFHAGETITSKIFAADLSTHMDYLVTVDPHLHRYRSLDEIYSVPSEVVQGAPALAQWLKSQASLLLVGPDAESEQWVSGIAAISGHPYVIGNKQRNGDRNVEVVLPDLSDFAGRSAMIIDDVISSGQTVLKCIEALQAGGIQQISCAAVHGIFADHCDQQLTAAGLQTLATTNTIAHSSNVIDISALLVAPLKRCLAKVTGR